MSATALAKRAGVAAVACTGYDILVGLGILDRVPADVLELKPKTSKFVVVTDTNVEKHLRGRLEAAFRALPDGAPPAIFYAIAPGETSKTRATKEAIEDWMLSQGCDRQSCVLAVGGGVVGDLAGFVASTFMRGCTVVQVPTSLLAMVDSSIGGKTGVDTPAGKNLVGAFQRPLRVYADPAVLRTLPRREICNGMAEVIKHGAIRSASLFNTLEHHVEQVLALEDAVLLPVIQESIAIKADVVVKDEKEGGLRNILNFGHSIGHGLEALLAPEWLHGECVAVGMVLETQLAHATEGTSPDVLNRLLSCLQAYSLPTKIPPEVARRDILHRMAVDKKNQRGVKRVVLIREIGNAGTDAHGVSDVAIARVLAAGAEVVPKPDCRASIRVPGSKSISNRVLLMAALGKGNIRITGLLHSDDTKVMLAALQSLGAPPFEWADGGHTLVLQGVDGKLSAAGDDEIYLANAGTASRFLTTACALAAGKRTILTGNKRMQERPIGPLVDALRANGKHVEYQKSDGSLPLIIPGGGLAGGEISLAATVSSQYVSSILIAAPYAKKPVHLKLTGTIVSQPFIDMTIQLMETFGVKVTSPAPGEYLIPKTGYTNPKTLEVESDASSASYPLAIAAATGGEVTVESIGSASIQGDARFCRVLEAMGCRVKQTAGSTTVTAPADKQLKAVDVDMSDVTDTFMTAAVLMATTPPGSVSRITNIANQRVKECDRIAAMAANFAQCGIEARELPDGLEIVGCGRNPPKKLVTEGANINCHHDHRIAMSFAVLGCLWPGIRIADKDCTDKTYPEFWADLGRIFGVETQPRYADELGGLAPNAGNSLAGRTAPRSLVIIGMRGAGKTHLGSSLAKHMRVAFVDLDDVLEKELEGGIKAFVEAKGWPDFRAREVEVLRRFLARCDDPSQPPTVVSCGGGVVETEEARALLSAAPVPVVWLRRHIDDIERYLEGDHARPAYGEGVRDVYIRRRPWFAACSTHEFALAPGDDNWPLVRRDFHRFGDALLGRHPPALHRSGTFFLSLTFPDLAHALAENPGLLAQVTEGAHAVELRVDMLGDMSADSVRTQVMLLRRHCPLPIIFTVRSAAEGGKFAGSERDFFALLDLAVRLGCEVVDVEACWSEAGRHAFLARRGPTLAIGSAHFAHPCAGAAELQTVSDRVAMGGRVDIVKMVYTARSIADVFELSRAHAALQPVAVKRIVLAMGTAGRLSRALNQYLSPVTHPKLPGAAAPGQLSVLEIRRLRAELGLELPGGKFCIFGQPLAFSPSPFTHNAVFEALHLPHHYGVVETSDLETLAATVRQKDWRGGSVTIPLKVAAMKVCDELSPAARAIGAVNTLYKEIPALGSRILGDNTDWVGIYGPLRQQLGQSLGAANNALVLGAGGTARAAIFALQQLGFPNSSIRIWNRTQARGEELAAEFGVGTVTSDALPTINWDTIVCTLPPEVQYVLDENVVKATKKPVVFDVAYRPKTTKLIAQAEKAGCAVVRGLDMFLAQAFEQQRVWLVRALDETTRADVQERVVAAYEATFGNPGASFFPRG